MKSFLDGFDLSWVWKPTTGMREGGREEEEEGKKEEEERKKKSE